MTTQTILDIGSRTIWVAVQVATPALLAAVVTGLVVSVFQAATQINEQTLTFIPKVLLMTVALVICGPWIMQTIIGFTVELITNIPNVIR